MKIRKLFRKRIIIPIIIVAVIVGIVISKGGNKESKIDFIVAENVDIFNEVAVTGNVKAAQSVDLAFETSGRVASVFATVGDNVNRGGSIVSLESGVLSAQLLQAQANLEAEQAILSEFQKGTRPEEIQLAQTSVANAERALSDDQINLVNIKEKADADLASDYDATLTALQKAVSIGKTALITLTDIQYAHFLGSSVDDTVLATKKENAVYILLGTSSTGRWSAESIADLKGGAFGDVQKAVDSVNDYSLIDIALDNTLTALQSVKATLDVVPITDVLTSTEKINLSTEKTNISTEVSSVSSKNHAILVQKVANQNAIATAQETINTANNTLLSAKDTLALKQAGSTSEQIFAQNAKVRSAMANVQNYQAQVGKTVLRSPITGVITRQDAKVGEIIVANSTLVSIISESKFEIEANIVEVDIAQISIGNTASVTLDAYGGDYRFSAVVVEIDPAETVIDGVSTYKVTLQFTEDDARIRSGMTANVDILTATKKGVIAIPQRAVIRRNGDKIVRLLKGEEVQEVAIEVGLKSSDARIEILSGINEGDRVVTFIEE